MFSFYLRLTVNNFFSLCQKKKFFGLPSSLQTNKKKVGQLLALGPFLFPIFFLKRLVRPRQFQKKKSFCCFANEMSIPRLLLLLLVVVVAAHTADASPYYVCPSAAQSIVAGSTSSSSSLCCPIGWIYKGGVCRTGVCANSADRYCAEATSLSCCPADTAYFEYMYCSSDGSCTGFDPQMSFILYHSSTAFTVTGSVAPSSVVDVSAHCVTTAPCLYGTACTPTIDSYTCACPLGFAPPNCTFQCPNGYECFSAPSGNSTAFNSSRVPAGSYLTLSSMIPTPTPLPCPVAYVCPVGSSQPVLCDGMYCPDTGMSTGLPCPAGFLCTAAYNGSTVPYVPAYACANLSLVLSANDPTACCPPDKSSSTHQQCYSGSSSCPSAGIMCTSPISCCNSGTSCSGGGQCLQVITPYNFYTPTTAFPTSVVSTVPSIEVHEHCIGWDPIANGCLHGTGCRATVLGAQCACPTNFVAPNCTFLAPPGAVIVTLPAVNSTIYESMPCLAGYSCTGGNNTLPTPMVECQAGQYCPSGSSNWIACPPGFFCPNAGLSAPVSCPSQATCPGFGNIASTYPVFACAITGDAPASNMNLYPATGLPVPLCCGGGGMWYANYGCLNTNTARCSVNGYVKCNGISLCCYQGWTCVLSSVYPQGAGQPTENKKKSVEQRENKQKKKEGAGEKKSSCVFVLFFVCVCSFLKHAFGSRAVSLIRRNKAWSRTFQLATPPLIPPSTSPVTVTQHHANTDSRAHQHSRPLHAHALAWRRWHSKAPRAISWRQVES